MSAWQVYRAVFIMEDIEDYVEKLRAVFDICDTEKKGYISVDHFVNLALEHFEAERREVCVDLLPVFIPVLLWLSSSILVLVKTILF